MEKGSKRGCRSVARRCCWREMEWVQKKGNNIGDEEESTTTVQKLSRPAARLFREWVRKNVGPGGRPSFVTAGARLSDAATAGKGASPDQSSPVQWVTVRNPPVSRWYFYRILPDGSPALSVRHGKFVLNNDAVKLALVLVIKPSLSQTLGHCEWVSPSYHRSLLTCVHFPVNLASLRLPKLATYFMGLLLLVFHAPLPPSTPYYSFPPHYALRMWLGSYLACNDNCCKLLVTGFLLFPPLTFSSSIHTWENWETVNTPKELSSSDL